MNENERETPKFKKILGKQLIELKKSYDFALKEAHSYLKKTTEERLKSCHFKYKRGEWLYMKETKKKKKVFLHILAEQEADRLRLLVARNRRRFQP